VTGITLSNQSCICRTAGCHSAPDKGPERNEFCPAAAWDGRQQATSGSYVEFILHCACHSAYTIDSLSASYAHLFFWISPFSGTFLTQIKITFADLNLIPNEIITS
jgi:hypothetical protein